MENDESKVEWDAKLIDDVWCVGMKGNLDTVYDAAIRVTGGWLVDGQDEIVARAIVAQHNALL